MEQSLGRLERDRRSVCGDGPLGLDICYTSCVGLAQARKPSVRNSLVQITLHWNLL